MFKPKGVMFLTLVIMFMAFSCSGPKSDQTLLTAELPLHLEEHLDAAMIEGSKVPEDLPAPVEWRFDEPQPDWKPVKPIPAHMEAVKPVRVEDALRLPLTARNRAGGPRLVGSIYVVLPDWNLQDWAYVEIRARTRDRMRYVGLSFNYSEEDAREGSVLPYYTVGDRSFLVTDGTVQTYWLSVDSRIMRRWEGPWTHLGIWFNSQADEEAVTLDILSVRVIPKEHIYAGAPLGVRTDKRNEAHRRTLYTHDTHAPERIEYRVRVPQAGRLDVGLGVLKEDSPVTFRIVASQTGKEEGALFEETYANQKEWGQRIIDLSSIAGKTVRIALEADAERVGTGWPCGACNSSSKAFRLGPIEPLLANHIAPVNSRDALFTSKRPPSVGHFDLLQIYSVSHPCPCRLIRPQKECRRAGGFSLSKRPYLPY